MTSVVDARLAFVLETTDTFDLDRPPPTAGPAAEYVRQLGGIRFHEQDSEAEPWTFWALAPEDMRWAGWARHVAQDKDRGWLAGVKHVWLARGGQVGHALVDVRAGTILQLRPRPTRTAATPPEGQP